MFAGFWHELALILDLLLNLTLFRIDKLLLPRKVLRHSLLHRFKPSAHLLGLATHRFWLEGAPRCLVLELLLLHVDDFLTRLLRVP